MFKSKCIFNLRGVEYVIPSIGKIILSSSNRLSFSVHGRMETHEFPNAEDTRRCHRALMTKIQMYYEPTKFIKRNPINANGNLKTYNKSNRK